MKRPLATGGEEPRVCQPLEMVAERRRREIHVPLNFASWRTAVAGLHYETQDRQTHGVAKGA